MTEDWKVIWGGPMVKSAKEVKVDQAVIKELKSLR